MSVVLVTGAAGALGSRLARRLLDGHPDIDVIGLDVLASDGPEGGRGYRFFQVPFGGPFPTAARAALRSVTHVAHLAAVMSVSTGPPGGRWTSLADPVQDLRRLLASAPMLRHIVFASSYMVYATPPPDPITEDAPLAPLNAYGWGKCAVEEYLECQPVAACRLRLAGVYGPGVALDQGRSVTEVMRAAVRQGTLSLHLPGTGLRSHLYIDDAVEALCRAVVEGWCGRYNVAGPTPVSVRDVVALTAEAARRPVRVEWSDGPPGWDAVLSTAALDQAYGFRATTGPREGLDAYYRWATTLPREVR
ncbi:NAD-dependent epimerase/dehydratase family protein [Micromonospora tulbaghiae]|uniref:NAD-dependent epimerase/dehydratase family protein n=1 Tax=Micromonospora tulbaghiae TaxID=479978 RepID=UPI00340A9D4B